MVDVSGDETMRLDRIFKAVPTVELDYLLAMLALPDGVARMKSAMLELLNNSTVYAKRHCALDRPARVRRETLYVLLSDVVKLPRAIDIMVIGHKMLGIDYPLERYKGIARRQAMCLVWKALRYFDVEEQNKRIAWLVNEMCDRPVEAAKA